MRTVLVGAAAAAAMLVAVFSAFAVDDLDDDFIGVRVGDQMVLKGRHHCWRRQTGLPFGQSV